MKTDYYKGKGCDCGAWADFECVCDEVDWTPKEVYDLREEVARMQQQIRNMQEIIDDDTKQKSELTNEVARLRELLNRAIKIANTLSGGGSRACRDLHHATKDLHKGGDVCPVEERLEKAVSDLAKLKTEAALSPRARGTKQPAQMNPHTPDNEVACPHCGAEYHRRRLTFRRLKLDTPTLYYQCGSKLPANGFLFRSAYCQLRVAVAENQKLRELLEKAICGERTQDALDSLWEKYQNLITK